MIRNTGVSAADVLAAAATGLSRVEILGRFPSLSESDISAVFDAAAAAFQTDPDLILPVLPVSLNVSGGAEGSGLVVRASAQIDGTEHIVVPRRLLETDDGISMAGVRWRLAREASQTLRLLLDRGRQDKHGQIVVRVDATPDVLRALRRRNIVTEDETAAAIVVENEPPVCVVSAEGVDPGGIRVWWWFEYQDGVQVPPRALSSALPSGWFRDGARFVPLPALPEDRPKWLELRNGQTTFRRSAALRFLRDDLPKLRSFPEEQLRLSGELAQWKLTDEQWRSHLTATLTDKTLRAVPGFVVGDRPVPVHRLSSGQRVAQVEAEWFVQPLNVDDRLTEWKDAGLRLDADTVVEDPDEIATLLAEDCAPLRRLADDVALSEDVQRVVVVNEPTRVVLQADVEDENHVSVIVGFAAGRHVVSWHELAEGPLDQHRWRDGDLVRFDCRAAESAARRLHDLGATVHGGKVVIARDSATVDPVRNDFQALREIGDVVVSRRLA